MLIIVCFASGGVGRSGAFIAIDHALQQLNSHGATIDIWGIVYEMHQNRRRMVQTEVNSPIIIIRACVVSTVNDYKKLCCQYKLMRVYAIYRDCIHNSYPGLYSCQIK